MQCDVQPKCGLSWKNIPFTPVCGGQTPTTLFTLYQFHHTHGAVWKDSVQTSNERRRLISSSKVSSTEVPIVQIENSELQSSKLSLPPSLFYAVENGAARYFFNDHVVDQSVVSSAFFSTLPDLYSKAPVGSALVDGISAAGLACFSQAKKSPNLMSRAALNYAAALRWVNTAIVSPIAARSDETLIVVVLLALYEEV